MYRWKLDNDGICRDQITGDAYGESSEEFEQALKGEFEFADAFVAMISYQIFCEGLTIEVE